MSDLRIALVAEGPTDKIAIEAFLSAITERSFILTPLQPEALNAFGGFGRIRKLRNRSDDEDV